jgi:Fic family protein
MRRFIWEDPQWPRLTVDYEAAAPALFAASFALGRVGGALPSLADSEQATVEFDALAYTALTTSEIEGERISRDSVRASLARRLHRAAPGELRTDDVRADGIVAVTLDAIQNANAPLTAERLWQWHNNLFPDAPRSLTVGTWRGPADDPMRVVSGPVQRRHVHFEAPAATAVAGEMDAFLTWLESRDRPLESIAKAALAHLWFLTIHPFADGNGRIGRAIADLVLARGATDTTAYVSLSGQILKERTQYYAALESAQRGALDVTQWVIWFAGCYERASRTTFALIEELLSAAAFWRTHATTDFNARQRKILQRYLAGGFEGWLNSSKYSKMADCSQDTAQRDLADLLARGVIIANDGSARRTSYRLTSDFDPNLRR